MLLLRELWLLIFMCRLCGVECDGLQYIEQKSVLAPTWCGRTNGMLRRVVFLFRCCVKTRCRIHGG